MIRYLVTATIMLFSNMSYVITQAINVVDNKEFRDFALYGRKNVCDGDLPHRTKLTELLFKTYETEHLKLVNDFKVRIQMYILQ